MLAQHRNVRFLEGYSLPAKAKVQDVKFKKFSIGSADYDSRQWIIGLESNNKFYGGETNFSNLEVEMILKGGKINMIKDD